MKIETLTYEAALERYPTEVGKCLAQLRNSRRRNKKAAPETLAWFLEMCVMVNGGSFGDMLDNAFDPPPVLSLDAQVADYMSRTRTSLNGAGYSAAVPTPDFVATQHRVSLEKIAADAAAFEALSADEKQESIQKLLKQLPGIRMVTVQKR
jgi:hypothetical protein